MTRLVIEPIGLHWLYDEEPGADLCAHAGIRLTFDGRILFESTTDQSGLSVSTAALNMLRSVEHNFVPGDGNHGDSLVPCCGHFMVMDERAGQVENIGCGNGVDWRVTHCDGVVRLTLQNGAAIELSESEWRDTVMEFSARVRQFYFAEPRRPSIDDAEWHTLFVAEWNRRHQAAQ